MSCLTDTGAVLRLRASIAAPERTLLPALRSLPCVQRVKALPGSTKEVTEVLLECDPAASPDAHTQLFSLLCGLNAPLRMLTQERSSLEDAFLRLTATDGE